MAFNFPANPVLGQEYDTGTGLIYVWNGYGWIIKPTTAAVPDGDKGDILVSGGGLTWTFDSGVITNAARTVLDDTTVAAMRTTLQAEPAIAVGTGSQFWRGDKTWQVLPPQDWSVITNKPALEPAITAGTTSDYWRGDKTWQPVSGIGGAYLPLAGGALTGPLSLSATGTAAATSLNWGAAGTGIYAPTSSSNLIYFTTAGVRRFAISNVEVASDLPVLLPAVDPTNANYAARKAYVDCPSDGGEYVRVGGTWRLMRKAYDLGGLTTIDIPVPATAKHARLSMMVVTAAGSSTPNMLYSADGTTFPSGAADYTVGGFTANTGSVGYVNQIPGTTNSIALAPGTDNGSLPSISDAQFNVARLGTYTCTVRAFAYWNAATNQMQHRWQTTYCTNATVSNAARLAALRIYSSTLVWTAGSNMTIEWMY